MTNLFAGPQPMKHSTVAQKSLKEAISYASLASAALDLDGKPEDAILIDEAIDTLTKAFERVTFAPVLTEQSRRSS